MNIKKLSRDALESLFKFGGSLLPLSTKPAADLPEWKRKSRDNQPARVAAPSDLNREHRASVLDEPVKFKRPVLRGKISKAKPVVNMSRAARLGLNVKEYEARRD